MKKLPVIIVLLALPFILWAAQESAALTDLVTAAEKNNLDLRKQEIATQAAKDAIGGIWKFANAALTLSGNLGYSYPEATGGGGPAPAPYSAELGFSVPVLNELIVTGGLNDKGDTNLKLTYNPFNIDTSAYKANENYMKALYQLNTLKKKTVFSVEQAVLDWNTANMNLAYLTASLQLASDKYDIRKKQYELGVSTYDELSADEQSLVQARQKYYDGQKTTMRNQQSIYSLLGAGMADTAIPAVPLAVLLEMIARREAFLAEQAGKQPISDRIVNLNLELETMKKQLKVLFPIQPNLSLSTSMGLPEFSFNAGVTAQISLSAKDIKFDDIADLKTQIAMKQEEIAAEKYNNELDVQMLTQSIQMAKELLELNKKDLESATTTYNEAQFYYKNGERTVTELQQAELNKQAADIRLYQGAISLYTAMADYLVLF